MDSSGTAVRPKVVVVGGGYGGIAVARALDETSDVVLIEPKDAFVHTIAALRALVDPAWLPNIFFPFAGLLANGRVVQDRAVEVEPNRVVTSSGEEFAADFVVLSTGSTYPFPAKTDLVEAERTKERVRATHTALDRAGQVLVIGAGPVGIELAGEIRHAWPQKPIVLLDVADEVLGGPYMSELKSELSRQLVESRVELILGSPLRHLPPTEPGDLAPFSVTTEAGTEIRADIWFRCFGVVPNSDMLGPSLASARRPDGFIEVTPTLQVAGQSTVFALGDVSTADAKMAGFAGAQAALVSQNINTLVAGGSDLAAYESMGVAIAVPIGPTGGAGQFPGQDMVVARETIAEVKGRDLMVDRFGGLFEPAAPEPV